MISHSRSESRNERSDQETCCRDRAVVYRLKSRNIASSIHIKAVMENEWHRKTFQSFRNYDNSQNINFVGMQIDKLIPGVKAKMKEVIRRHVAETIQ